MRGLRHAVLISRDLKSRDVRSQMALAEIRRQPAPAFEIDADLGNARVRAAIERSHRGCASHAIILKPFQHLQGLHRRDGSRVHLAGVAAGLHQAQLDEARLHFAYARRLHPRLEGRAVRYAGDWLGRRVAQSGQFRFQQGISGLHGGELFQTARYRSGLQRIGQDARKVDLPLSGRPVRLDRDGVQLAVQHVGGGRHPGIGRDPVALG